MQGGVGSGDVDDGEETVDAGDAIARARGLQLWDLPGQTRNTKS